jgi:glutamine---fructose-6-phosphate transaminase (isomerizing)
MSEHFFLKELREQPEAVAETLASQREAIRKVVEQLPADLNRIMMVGCGDPYFASQAAIYPLEQWSRLPTEAVDALEFRLWRSELVDDKTLVVLISQSGKTIQVVESGRLARERGASIVVITNSPDGPLAQDYDNPLLTAGGTSYSFPTRTTTTATALLFALGRALGEARGKLSAERAQEVRAELEETLPRHMEAALGLDSQMLALARSWVSHSHFAFIGTGPGYAAALIGAAKVNETSRLSAEADELEEYGHLHVFGIQRGTPLFFLAPSDLSAARVRAMVEFATGRGHPVAVFVAEGTTDKWQSLGLHIYELPDLDERLSPLVYSIPLQLFAYHLAITRGANPDRPEGFDNIALQNMIYTGLLEGWHEDE